MKLRFSLPAVALALASGLGHAQAAAPIVQGRIHFLFLDGNELPMADLTLSGTCESRLGPFWNSTRHQAPWSCTTSSDGICSTPVETLAAPDGAPVPCRGTDRSTVRENGASPERISYLAFFAKGAKDNYALVHKRTGWKDGQYSFRSVDSAELFDALAMRYRSSFYAGHMHKASTPTGGTVWDLQAAHPQENPDEQNLVYLRAERSANDRATRVDVRMTLTYVDEVIRRYDQAHYQDEAGGKDETRAALATLSDGNTCGVRDLLSGQCKYREELSLPLPMALVTRLAGRYREGEPGNWRLRITTPRGQELDFLIAYAEFAALADALGN